MPVRMVVFVGWLVWLLIYWKGGLTTLRDIRAADDPTDRLLLIAITTATLALLASMLAVLVGWLPAMSDVLLTVSGAALALVGIGGTFYCRAYLGRYWTAEASVTADHRIIDAGPYGVVRHPIYAFAILLYVGTALAFLTTGSVVCAGMIVAGYVLKSQLEDRFLLARLPGYAAYTLRVPYRLLPGIW